MRGEAWFRPKAYGYGATPKNWKGWLAIAVFLAVISVTTWELTTTNPLLSATITLALTITFVGISKVKTEGEWRWRWGS